MSPNKGTFKTAQGTHSSFGRSLSLLVRSVRDRWGGIFDRASSRERADHRLLLQDYARELTSAPLETERILATLFDHCEAGLHPEQTAIFLHDTASNTYSMRKQTGISLPPDTEIRFGADDDLPRRLAVIRSERPHGNEALHLSPGDDTAWPDDFSREELGKLSLLAPELVVPLNGTKRLIGWIMLGAKRSGEPYRENDLVFLTTLTHQTVIALENAQLLEAAERRAFQLDTLNHISRVINQTLDLDAVLQLIMEKSLELLNAEAGSLLLADDDGQALSFEVALSPVGNQLRGVNVALNRNSIAGTVARDRQPLIVGDARADPRWDTTFDQTTGFHTLSLICVPMISRDRLVGVIELLNKRPPACFAERDIELLGNFAAQAAIAIENARLFTMTDQALAGRVQELRTMQLIDRQLNATLDLNRVMDLTLEHAMHSVSASTGAVGVMNEAGSGLRLVTQRGTSTGGDHLQDETWPIERGNIGQAARTGRPVVTGNVRNDQSSEPLVSETCSQMSVPILYQDAVRAVISLESPHPDAFSQQDLDFIIRLADHAAIAIENARLYEQAQAANQAKTEFMSVASHELKIPMTSIKGYAKLLTMGAGGDLNEQQSSFLDIISSNVDRMDRLVSDLLDVSRIEAGRLRVEMGQVDMQEVINAVVQSVRAEIEAKQLALEVNVPTTLPPVQGDNERIIQILTNLVSNAYKYTPSGGQIYVTIDGQADDATSGCLTISVRDTGVGISLEDQQKLFTKFFRADDPRVRDVPGTGLGLSITKSLVEIHGGEIWLQSEPEHGTTFTFTLPIAGRNAS